MSTYFLINRNLSTPHPNSVRLVPPPEVGRTMNGRPIRQGYPSLEVTWKYLSYTEMTWLMTKFALRAQIELQYPYSDTSHLATYTGIMHQPVPGSRNSQSYFDVTCVFSHLSWYVGPAYNTFYSDTPAPTVPAGVVELLTDGDLEATYTMGICNSLVLVGQWYGAGQTSSSHSGAKAQRYQGEQLDGGLRFPAVTGILAGHWYRWTAWAKRWVTRSDRLKMRLEQGATVSYSAGIESGEYAQFTMIHRAIDGSNILIYPAYQATGGSGTGDEIVTDDHSFQRLSWSSLLSFAYDNTVKSGTFDGAVTVASLQAGIACCVDDSDNPLYGLFAVVNRSDSKVYAFKLVNGVVTDIITPESVNYLDGKTVRIVVTIPSSGITQAQVKIYYGSNTAGWVAIGLVAEIPATVDLSLFGTEVCVFDVTGTATTAVTVK